MVGPHPRVKRQNGRAQAVAEALWQIEAIERFAVVERAIPPRPEAPRLRVLRPAARWDLIGLWRTPQDEALEIQAGR